MMMQELGLKQQEHAELHARHEQLQHALRLHEQVTHTSRCNSGWKCMAVLHSTWCFFVLLVCQSMPAFLVRAARGKA